MKKVMFEIKLVKLIYSDILWCFIKRNRWEETFGPIII